MPPSPTGSPAATPTVLPPSPPGEVTAGLGWATADHAIAIVNNKGTITEQFLIDATGAGLRELVRRLRRAQVGEIAIERGDGQVVDNLLDAGLTVVVISPNQVHNLRGRYGSAGNKDDRFDTFVLADTLRTDRARLRPLIPDPPARTTSTGSARPAWLRGSASSATPAARIPPPCTLTWVAAAPGVTGPTGAAAAAVTGAFVAALTGIVAQIHALDTHIAALLSEHVDAHIFLSLPRAQALRAARLLAEIGDCRARFPIPESLASLAGVTPSTRQSGKMKTTSFR